MHNQTKNLIAVELSNMISSQPFDTITITELVERCNISRQAFYYHFTELMDVLEWIINHDIAQVESDCLKTDDLKEGIKIALHYGLNHRKFISNLLESKFRVKIEPLLLDAIRKILSLGISFTPYAEEKSDIELKAFIEFFSYGILGLLLFWDIDIAKNIDATTERIHLMITTALTTKEY